MKIASVVLALICVPMSHAQDGDALDEIRAEMARLREENARIRGELDRMIGQALSDGWSIDRLARIELAVLRCGAHELNSMQHIPARAVVSEYAALSDACGCEVGFVNAVLDGLARGARLVEMES